MLSRNAVLALLFLAGVAFGADVVLKYPSDATALVGELPAISAADVGPLDSSDYASRPIVILNHNKALSVSASFSSPGATASIGIIRGRMVGTTFVPSKSGDSDWGTLSADSTYTVGGRYIAKATDFDPTNAEAAMVFVRSVSAGDVVVGWRVH